jgi:hypothetical protein
MSQKDLKDQDNLEAQLQNDVELDDKVEVSEDVVDEATLAAKGDAKSANFGQGADFEDDKKKNLATTSKQPVPKTKSGIISAAVDKLSGMKKEDLQVVFSKLFNEESEEVAQIVEEDEVSVVSEEQVQEDLKALVESDANLSEEFKEKATVLFNSALTARLSEEVQKLEEKKISELAEEVESIRSELVEKIDGYLNYVVEQWMEENELAVETGLRAEIAESFMTQLQQVFVEHYIEVPEGKADLIDDLAEQVQELEGKLQESTEKSVKLAEELETLQRAEIIAEASTGLAATEVEKLESLVEGVDYDDAESFAKKVQIVKEAHFKKATVGSIQEEITEDSSEQTTTSPRMAAYVSAISRTLK